MDLSKLFKKKGSLLGIDIGGSSLKLVEIDINLPIPRLLNAKIQKVNGEVFLNNIVTNQEKVKEGILKIIEGVNLENKRIVTGVPGPSVFTKKIKVPKLDKNELKSHIQFEAGNLIPHNINAVKLDYHIIGESGKNNLDVLIVAVKNEVIDSILSCFALADLEVAIVDVDQFALQNIFENNYPELFYNTVAIVNIGSRYSSVNICKGGESLFTGDIPIGGKAVNDEIQEATNLKPEQVEKIKNGEVQNEENKKIINDIIQKNSEFISTEINRQLGFFCTAIGNDEGLDNIILSGGSALLKGLVEAIQEKTEVETFILDPFLGFDIVDTLNADLIKKISPQLSICMGMSLRKFNDKIVV